MDEWIVLIPVRHPTASQLAELRTVAPEMSLAELKRSAQKQQPVYRCLPFSGEWPAPRAQLESFCVRAEQGNAPFSIHLQDEDGETEEIGPRGLREHLDELRGIEERDERLR